MIVVPYIVEEHERGKAFTKEMERAAILCLSEAKRKKPSILRGSAEETECIAKLSYPLWAVPWSRKCIVADGLGLSSATISYNHIPNVLDFTEDLKRSSISFSLFKETLEKHEHTFKGFSSAEKVVLNDVIADSSALEDLSKLTDQAKPQKEMSETDVVMAPIMCDRTRAENVIEKFIHEQQRLQTDADGLRFASHVLRDEIEHHKEKASIELELLWGDYENRISKMKKEVDGKVRKLDKEREKEATKAERLIGKETSKLALEEKKYCRKAHELKRSLDSILTQKRIQKRKYPKRSTTRINSRISSYEERIRQVNSEIHHISDLQEKTREKGRRELKQIEERHLNLVAKEMEKLEILEQSRKLETTRKKEELTETEELSSKIVTQIENLIALKVKDMEILEKMALHLEAEEPLLIGVPFYIIQYRLRERTRTDLYPPMMAASYEGILKRIQKAILSFSLEGRMQLLLDSRSSNLNKVIFSNLRKCLSTDSTLREQVTKVACLADLLAQPGFKEQVVKGLVELESEGWLNSKEKENMIRSIMQ